MERSRPRRLEKLIIRWVAAMVLATIASWGALAAPSLATSAASNVAVSLSPADIAANGTSTSTVTATVTNGSGTRIPGETVAFSSSDNGVQFGTVSDNGDGTYTATVTSSTTPGTPTITATDTSVTPNITGTGTLIQHGPATQVGLQLSKGTIADDGREQTIATATVTDGNNNPVPGDAVTFAPTAISGVTVGQVHDNGDGTYTAAITGNQVSAGSITASDGGVSSTGQPLSVVAPTVTLSLSPSSIAADGIDHTTATVTITDGNGTSLPGDNVTLGQSGLGGASLPTLVDHGDGTYTGTITDSTAEAGTVTATDNIPSAPASSSPQNLSAVAPTVGLALSHGSIADNGTDQTVATVTITGPNGNLPSENVTIAPDSNLSGLTIANLTNHGNGTYTATVKGNQVSSGSILATDASPSTAVQSSRPLSVVAPTVNLVLSHGSIADNGIDQTVATATITGPNGNLTGENVTIAPDSNLSGLTISNLTNHGDGTYTSTITGNQVSSGSIVATDNSGAGSTPGSQPLSVLAPTVNLVLSHGSIADDGIDQTVATATITGPNGNLTGENVTIAPSGLTGVTAGTVSNHGDGTYTSTITGNRVSSGSIVATDNSGAGSTPGSQPLSVLAPTVSLAALSPSSIADDGIDQTTATASVTGPNGALPSDTVTFTPSGLGGVGVSSVTNHGDGTYTVTITGTQAGPATITASDTSPNTAVASTGRPLTLAAPAVSVALSKNQITADGNDSSTATATVTGPNGALRSDNVNFAGTNGVTFGNITNHGDGTYSAPVTGTHAGSSAVTATDHSPATAVTSQSQALSLTAGPGAVVTVNLTPSSIPADGTSHSTATAVVTDANGNQVFGDSITFTATNGVTVVQNGGTATLTSSNQTVPSTVQATDTTRNISGTATLNQVPVPSTTSLTSSPATSVTNQGVNLFAAVASGSGSPVGAITFQDNGNPIPNCAGMSISSGHLTATCTTAFGSTSTTQLTAVFTPASGSNVAPSSSSPYTLSVSRDATTMLLGFSNNDLRLGQDITYSALVTPAHTGSASPSGSVQFLDHGVPISSCANQPLSPAGGTFEAMCTVAYTSVSTHSISATYAGDSNFGGSGSGPITIPVNVVGLIASPMRWTFAASANYTKVLAFAVKNAEAGSTILVICKGKSCPYARKEMAVSKSGTTVNLAQKFAKRQLKPGTKITVYITRTYWKGRYYSFTIRAKKAPQVTNGCLAEGTLQATSC